MHFDIDLHTARIPHRTATDTIGFIRHHARRGPLVVELYRTRYELQQVQRERDGSDQVPFGDEERQRILDPHHRWRRRTGLLHPSRRVRRR